MHAHIVNKTGLVSRESGAHNMHTVNMTNQVTTGTIALQSGMSRASAGLPAALSCKPAAAVAMAERPLVTVHHAVQQSDIDLQQQVRLVNALLGQNPTATDSELRAQLLQMMGATYPVKAALQAARAQPSAVAPPTVSGKTPSTRRSNSASPAYPVGIHPSAASSTAQRAVSTEVRWLSHIY